MQGGKKMKVLNKLEASFWIMLHAASHGCGFA